MAKEKYEHGRIVNAIYNEVYSMDVAVNCNCS